VCPLKVKRAQDQGKQTPFKESVKGSSDRLGRRNAKGGREERRPRGLKVKKRQEGKVQAEVWGGRVGLLLSFLGVNGEV